MAGISRNETADKLVEDLLQITGSHTVLELQTQRFKLKGRITHAETWISTDGKVSVVFKVETVGAPQPLEPVVEPGWKE